MIILKILTNYNNVSKMFFDLSTHHNLYRELKSYYSNNTATNNVKKIIIDNIDSAKNPIESIFFFPSCFLELVKYDLSYGLVLCGGFIASYGELFALLSQKSLYPITLSVLIYFVSKIFCVKIGLFVFLTIPFLFFALTGFFFLKTYWIYNNIVQKLLGLCFGNDSMPSEKKHIEQVLGCSANIIRNKYDVVYILKQKIETEQKKIMDKYKNVINVFYFLSLIIACYLLYSLNTGFFLQNPISKNLSGLNVDLFV